MLLVYENKQQMVSAEWKTPVHMPPHLHEAIGSDDLIYSSIAYVAKNYSSRITLEKMANDLGVSKYVLSRMFAKTFHCNFSKYVNGVRLNNPVTLLRRSM